MRDVPDDMHAALQCKTELRHQLLQQYLALELRHLAGRRSISEVLDEVEGQHGGRVGFAVAVTDVDDEQLDFERAPTLRLVPRAFELRAHVSVYDACYVALAEYLDCELITADARLAGATGPPCPIRVLR